ncbi:hypothetical protein SLA2020_455660 [Shorea laevis]
MRTGQRMAMAFDFLVSAPERHSPSSRNRNGRRKQWQQQRRSGEQPTGNESRTRFVNREEGGEVENSNGDM